MTAFAASRLRRGRCCDSCRNPWRQRERAGLPACFGAQESSLIDGAKLGVVVLLAVTLAVQGAFLGFFLYLRRRAKRIADLDLDTEWSELQGASRTS